MASPVRFIVLLMLTFASQAASAGAQEDLRRCPSLVTPGQLRGTPSSSIQPEQQYCAGLLLFRGSAAVPRDPARACHWHSLAAQRGHAGAQAAYGFCLESGAGGKSDPTGALAWYRKSAEQGNADAMLALAGAYQAGRGVRRDDAEATRWAQRAANAGSDRARAFLRRSGEYRTQTPTRPTTREAYASYKAQDYPRARALYRQAADAGDPSAQVALGTMLRLGLGGPVALQDAVAWYRKAADAGHARAQAQLGFAYEYGEGVTADWREAARWCVRAAQQAERLGLYCAGRQFQFGIGVPQDRARAIALFDRAADQGDQSAAFFARWLRVATNCTGYRDERERERFTGVCVNPSGLSFATPTQRDAWLTRQYDQMNRESLRAWAGSDSSYFESSCRAAGGRPVGAGCQGHGGRYFSPYSGERNLL